MLADIKERDYFTEIQQLLKAQGIKNLPKWERVWTCLLYQKNSIPKIFSRIYFDWWLLNIYSLENLLWKKNPFPFLQWKHYLSSGYDYRNSRKALKKSLIVMVYLHVLFSIFHFHWSVSWMFLQKKRAHWTKLHSFSMLFPQSHQPKHISINISILRRFQYFPHNVANMHLDFVLLHAYKTILFFFLFRNEPIFQIPFHSKGLKYLNLVMNTQILQKKQTLLISKLPKHELVNL